METETEKLISEEIDHLVLDTNKKVTLATISNNWNIPNQDGIVVLEKWLENYSGDREIAKEYLIRGVDSNGNGIITIVSEKSLQKVEKIYPSFTKTLYSIEIGSLNGKSLNVIEPATNKYIALKLKSIKRNIKVHAIVVPEKSIKKETEAPKKANIFGAAQSKPTQSKEVKTDSAKNSKNTKVKEEKTSPKKSSPKKNQAPPKAQQGKSSISSFFASKPTTSQANKPDKSVSDASTKIESVQINDEPIEVSTNDTKVTQKRPHSNASDSNEDFKGAEKKQTQKKPKLALKSKHSRLMQLCDSSSDEEETSNNKDRSMDIDEEEVVVKKEKENKTPSPEKSQNNISNGGSSGKRRTKVKKTVTRTYEDEDGFINTVREIEEVSCSEEEPEVSAPPPKKPATTTNHTSSTATKKKISPSDGKKQGSILSFFGKK